MAVFKLSQLTVATLAMLSAVAKAYPSAMPQEIDDSDVSTSENTTTTFVATYIGGIGEEAPNPDDLIWTNIALSPTSETRLGCIDCNDCRITADISVTTDSKGNWWTDWCRVDGLTTHNKGDSVSIAENKMKSTTINAEVTVSVPMIKSLEAKLGYSVTTSVGWGKNYGCVNQDGTAHGLWLQENIGWAWQTVTTTYSQEGRGCSARAPTKRYSRVQVNYPDPPSPNKTGFRQFQYQCGWDVKGGRSCDFDSGKHI